MNNTHACSRMFTNKPADKPPTLHLFPALSQDPQEEVTKKMTTPTAMTKRRPPTNSTGKSPLLPLTAVVSPVEKSMWRKTQQRGLEQ